jgi:hypothetical protein
LTPKRESNVNEQTKLRPISKAPVNGIVVEILVATADRGWIIAHSTYGETDNGGPPRFLGWFYWTGSEVQRIETATIRGWLPLPVIDG